MGKKEQRAAAKAARQECVATAVANESGGRRVSLFQQLRKRALSIIIVVVALPVVLAAVWPRHLQVVAVDRVAYTDMTTASFLSDFSAKRPVVVEGALAEEGWRPAEVAATCPQARIKTHLYDETSKSWARHEVTGEVPLQEYFDKYFAADSSERPSQTLYGFEMALKTQCPQQLTKLAVPPFLAEDAFHLVTNGSGLGWPSILMGPRGSETGLHIDTHRLPFWIAVMGAPGSPLKRVRIFPHDNHRLLKYGQATDNNNFHFDFHPWRPNLRKYPEVADSFVYETELKAGDLLYIPGGSPHAVLNLDDNLGVSMNFLDLKSLPEFVKRCNKGSPLCGLVSGKGEWVLAALDDKRKVDKPLGYYEYAGLRDKAEFCAVHASVHDQNAALKEFCS